MTIRRPVALSLGLLLPLLGSPLAPAAAQEVADVVKPGDTIEFAADTLTYEETNDTVTATGNVVVTREGYRLRADEVSYDRKTGFVEARGNVVIVDPEGNQAYGERVEVSESLRDATIENILIVLDQGGRLAARSGTRIAGRSELNRAVYSPCAVADAEGCPKQPLWQIKAVKVVHDPTRKRLYYQNATLEFFGIPVLYLPELSHPDGEARNASGLLVPDVRYRRALGFGVDLPYFLSLSPETDLTLTPTIYTDANPVLGFEGRHLFDGGPVRIGAIGTWANRLDAIDSNGSQMAEDEKIRGYVFANGQLQHDSRWRSTFGVRWTTDDTFLRRYDISRDDSLRNFYTLERFGSDSYLTVEGWAFQGLRVTDRPGITPVALPLIDFQWRPESTLLGGRTQIRANSLAITRTDGQDMQRALLSARWDRSHITTLGQRITATLLARGDVYHVSDANLAEDLLYAGSDGFQARAIPVAALDFDWPLAGAALGGIQTLTPRVQVVASPTGLNKGIPNEDARATDLEDINLFSLNRFPGYDRWEGGTRVTYGAQWTLDRPGWRIQAELGQSYRLSEVNDLVPSGTGFTGNFSDVVGRLDVRWGSFITLTHRFRLDKKNLDIRRNEVDATIGGRSTYATVSYVRLNRDIELEDLEDREEVRLGARVQVARNWSLFGSTVIDLTSQHEQPLSEADGFEPVRHRLGIAYEDECFELGVTWRRDYTRDRDYLSGNTFLVRIALKNLGR